MVQKYFKEVIYFIKVLFALVGIVVIYILGYPIFYIKNKLFKNIIK